MKTYPSVFYPFGCVDSKRLESELQRYNFTFPKELIEMWLQFGGGDLFEIYTILYPLENKEDKLDIYSYNLTCLQEGFNSNYFIFASDDSYISAFQKKDKDIAIFFRNINKVYAKEKNFPDINHWFEYLWSVNI